MKPTRPVQKRLSEVRFLLAGALLVVALFAPGFGRALAADPLSVWNPRVSPTNVNLTAVTFGNNTFVAMSDHAGIVLTSPDGVSWTQRTSAVPTREVYGVGYGAGVFVAAGDVGKIITSPDGVTWTKQTSGTTANLDTVSFINNQFVVCGSSGAIFTSPNGIQWTPHPTPTTNVWRGAAYGPGGYVLTGVHSVSGKALAGTTSDFSLVSILPTGFSQGLYSLAYGAGRYVSGGWGGYVFSSTDGKVWNTTNRLGSSHIKDVRYLENLFIAVGEDGRIETSPDGTTWTKRAGNLSNPALAGVTYGLGTFVAVGYSGTIFQSGSSGPEPEKIVLSKPGNFADDFWFEFNATIGQAYQVEATTDFKSWSPVKTITATGSPMPCFLPDQPGARTFYRVVK